MRTVIRNEKFLYIKIVPVFSAENRRFFVVMQTEKGIYNRMTYRKKNKPISIIIDSHLCAD